MPVRTGYEKVIGHRTDDDFCKVAEADGTITKISKEALTIKYEDGTVKHHPLGRQFGTWSGKVIPSELVAAVKNGQTVKKGDVLTYNDSFFSKDNISPNEIIYKGAVLARTVLWESDVTLEDSCALSTGLSKHLKTTSTHVRTIMVDQTQSIINLVNEGDEVNPDTILCTIVNPTSMAASDFDPSTLSSLENITQLTPRAKYQGKVERIEAIYTADIDNMSESLSQIVSISDGSLYRRQRRLGKNVTEAKVEMGYRPDGVPMNDEQVAIKVYITGKTGMGTGDKLVLANQMKSTVGRVFEPADITDLDGEPIDMVFGYQSIHNRIVSSPEIIGTTSTLSLEIGKLVIEAYDQ